MFISVSCSLPIHCSMPFLCSPYHQGGMQELGSFFTLFDSRLSSYSFLGGPEVDAFFMKPKKGQKGVLSSFFFSCLLSSIPALDGVTM